MRSRRECIAGDPIASGNQSGLTSLPRVTLPVPGPTSHKLARLLHQYESQNITYFADNFPIFWEEATGCMVTDVDGNTFLDMSSAFGVAAVGHGHPDVVAAIRNQAEKLLHSMGDVHPSRIKVDLCRAIAERAPWPLAKVILGQNGSDAVEAALKTCKLATGRPGVLAFDGGYHGLSYGALEITSRPDFRAPFRQQLGGFSHHLPYGASLSLIDETLSSKEFGAVIVEPIQGRGGIIVPPKDWILGLKEAATRNGALLVADEIFTGWGRTGFMFACEYEEVIPDILVVGKAMGGGMPIAACIAPASIMDNWPASLGESLHTYTFLGNPVACSAAIAAIHVIDNEQLVTRARSIGYQFSLKLQTLAEQYPSLVLSVRGRGLMLGLEFASPEIVFSLIPRALQSGLILLPAGDGRVIEFVPPLVIEESQLDWCLEVLNKLLDNTAK